MNHDAYSDAYIRSILRTTKSVAMVGASANEARTSYIVLKYLLARGYRVFPINPALVGKDILGQRVYLPRYGVGQLHLFDFTASAREPKLVARWSLPEEIHRGPGGKWVDRWTAGSPLIHDNISYQCDIYQELFALDLKTGKMLYRQPLDLAGLMHYNAVPVAASLTLVGKHIAACDNQGTTILFEPGPTFKMVARNRIATQLDRILPLPAQETLTYAPPICDGGRLYLRGEAFLYCIGEK